MIVGGLEPLARFQCRIEQAVDGIGDSAATTLRGVSENGLDRKAVENLKGVKVGRARRGP